MAPVRQRILVLAAIPPELRAALSARYELVEYAAGETRAGWRVAVTTSVAGASASLIAALPDLGLIACNGAGTDRIDLAQAERRGILVRHTPDEVTEDTADAAIGLIYAVSRRIAEADRFVRAGRWASERLSPSRRVSGKRAGLVGLGRIGTAIARRAAALGMTVAYTGPRPKPDAGYPFVADIAELAGRVDMLILSCPGGEATRHLVNVEVLRRLGPDGILINVARGTVVQEEALIAALSGGTIAGAGLDVFAQEPGLDPRFLALENVVLQPHYAAVTRETRAAMAQRLLGEIAAFLGEPAPA